MINFLRKLFQRPPIAITRTQIGRRYAPSCDFCRSLRASIDWDHQHGYEGAAELMTAHLSRHCEIAHGAKKP